MKRERLVALCTRLKSVHDQILESQIDHRWYFDKREDYTKSVRATITMQNASRVSFIRIEELRAEYELLENEIEMEILTE